MQKDGLVVFLIFVITKRARQHLSGWLLAKQGIFLLFSGGYLPCVKRKDDCQTQCGCSPWQCFVWKYKNVSLQRQVLEELLQETHTLDAALDPLSLFVTRVRETELWWIRLLPRALSREHTSYSSLRRSTNSPIFSEDKQMQHFEHKYLLQKYSNVSVH